MISSRLDLSFAISLLSSYMSNPGHEHWKSLQYVLSYISSSVEAGLVYKRRYNTLDLVRYIDSNFVGDKDPRKSTATY